MASTRLEKTFTASNRKTFTISTWIKRSGLTANNSIYGAGTNDSSDRDYLAFLADSGEEDKLYFNAKVSNSTVAQFYTNRRFRDTSAWYHIVLAFDTTQATDTNRMKLYVNGEQQTYQSVTYPSQNQDMNTNNTVHKIGSTVGNGQYFDGSMTHFHFVDGTAYDADDFGESDSVSGIWIPKTAPSVTYGTNGAFLKFENSGAMGTDSSGNSNTFTVNGTLTQNVDTPSNVFCVINAADRFKGNNTNTPDNLQNGATKMVTSNASFLSTRGSIGVTSGKWYWEAKQGAGNGWAIGICNDAMVSQTSAQFWDNTTITGVAINGSSGTAYVNGANGDSWNQGTSVNSNTLYGFALDMDNRAFYISINGTYLTANGNVGNPTSGSSRTGSVLGELTTRGGTGGLNYIPQGELIYPFQADVSGSTYCEIAMNFGQGYFGTTAVASAGTAPSEGGIFEYDCPTGYQSLCTKGINSF